MNNAKRNAKAPTHAIYMVNGQGDKAFWTKIGCAWPHSDGDGQNLHFDAFPIAGASIVVRKITKKDA